MSAEEPSIERVAACAEVVVEQLLVGGLEPLDVPLPESSVDTAWLNRLERAIFVNAPAMKRTRNREHLRCEWGGFRLVRRLADDDATAVRALCERVVGRPKLNARLRRLLDALRSYNADRAGSQLAEPALMLTRAGRKPSG
jgi:hypothetical protein